MIRQKRGQVTVFIIIGILMLLGTALYFIFSEPGDQKTEVEVVRTGQVPTEIQAQVREYVQSCLGPVTLQGLEIQRLQGGYINIPKGTESLSLWDSEYKYVTSKAGSKKVGIGNQKLDVPYWVRKDELAVPTMGFFESELESYIRPELEKCLGDFEPFKSMKYNITRGETSVKVSMKNIVLVEADVPLQIRRDDEEIEMRDFIYRVPIDMEKVQKLASEMAMIEWVYSYVEDDTMNLVVLYSGIDEEMLPPIGARDANTDGEHVTWTKSGVNSMLKDILNYNVPNIKVEKTKFKRYDDPGSGIYDSFTKDFFQESYPEVEINFSYEKDWPIDLEIVPSQGESIVPDKIVSANLWFLPSIHVFRYRFKYDIEYPVLVKVTDFSSAKIDPVSNTFEENEGYTMQFPMKIWIYGNQKRQNTGRYVEQDPGIIINESLGDIEKKAKGSYFGDEAQKVKDIKLRVYDKDSGSPLAKVSVYYSCANRYESTYIGQTDENGKLEAKWPSCLNGEAHLIKADYETSYQKISTKDAQSERWFSLYLESDKNLTMEVKKIHLPTLVYYLDYTNSFKDTAKTIRIAKQSGMDTTEVEGKARGLGLDTSAFPITLLDRSQKNIRDTASKLGISLVSDAYGGIDYLRSERLCVNEILQGLSQTEEYKDMLSEGKKEKLIAIMELKGDEKASVSTTSGPKYMAAMYPGNNRINLVSGDYSATVVIEGKVSVKPSYQAGQKISFNGDGSTYTGQWGLGTTDVSFSTGPLSGKKKIIFFGFVDFDSEDEIDFNQAMDVLKFNNSIHAELLYRCGLFGTNSDGNPDCDYDNCDLVGVSGTLLDDYSPDPKNCIMESSFNMGYDEYYKYIKPKII